MSTFQGLFFTVLGLGLLAVDVQSLGKGWLPCGPNGLRGSFRVERQRSPAGYWLMFVFYAVFGGWLTVTGLRILTGHTPPLPIA